MILKRVRLRTKLPNLFARLSLSSSLSIAGRWRNELLSCSDIICGLIILLLLPPTPLRPPFFVVVFLVVVIINANHLFQC